jgi:heme-degrading monooxygenase HmoA
MIVEYIRYTIPADRAAGFEAAYTAARVSLDESVHCLGYELSRGVEEPDNYILRIEWDSLEGHEQGFRQGPEFRQFFQHVRPFFNDIAEMRHYRAVFSTTPMEYAK